MPTHEEVQKQTEELTLAVAGVLPRKPIPAALVRASARVVAAMIGAVGAPDERITLAVSVAEIWCDELRSGLKCLAERDGGEDA
jgi:hypothetical protein